MRKALALVWLVLVMLATGHVVWSARDGLPLQTDLMALLPAEERDPVIGEAKRLVSDRLSERVILLVGHASPDRALDAASRLRARLVADGVLVAASDLATPEALRQLGQTYFNHRHGLLAEADRVALLGDRAGDLVQRALAQIYGVGGMADARLIAQDPFLIFPAFMADLPFGNGKFQLVDGWPTIREGTLTWVVLNGKVLGKSLSLRDQDRFVASYQAGLKQISAADPGIQVKRLGAVFFAQAAAKEALGESAFISILSVFGTILLILGVFRSVWPLLLTLLAVIAGITCALSVSLASFGSLHVAVTIFGASLIGVTVDYALHYCAQAFEPSRPDPFGRLRMVLPGILIGLATTLIGYLALMASPLPGLHQAALFSIVGLAASFLTVALWFPFIDRTRPRLLAAPFAAAALLVWRLWDDAALRKVRSAIVLLLLIGAAIGAAMLTADDDIRRQQGLDPILAREQEDVRQLIGSATSNQFFLVRSADADTALVIEEQLGERLARVKAQGGLGDWRSPARLVPSLERQLANAKLRTEILDLPHLAQFRARIGLPAPQTDARFDKPLKLAELLGTKAVPFLDVMVLRNGMHVVILDNARDTVALREAAKGIDGVVFVDPAADFSELLGRYRTRAMGLIAASALVMAGLLCFRYGLKGALMTLAPPFAAVLLTPPLLALLGVPFTFFGAMALIMVLSMGVDYSVFCAETQGTRDPVTMLAVCLATATTALSFGLMAFSQAAGVRSFGAVILLGIVLAFLLAPFAGRVRRKSVAHAL